MSGVVSDPISVQMEMSEDVSGVQMSRIWLAWLHHTLSCPGVTMSTFHTSSLQYSIWARVTIVCSHIIQLSLMSVPVPPASGRPGCCYLHLKFFVSKHPTLFCIKSNVTHYTLLHITPYILLQSRAQPSQERPKPEPETFYSQEHSLPPPSKNPEREPRTFYVPSTIPLYLLFSQSNSADCCCLLSDAVCRSPCFL